MKLTDEIQKIRKKLERLKEETSIGLSEHENGVEQGRMEIIEALSFFLDSLQKEPVSEDTPFEPIGIPADAVELANIPNKKEPTIPDIVDEHFYEMLGEESVSEDLEKAAEEWDESLYRSDAFKAGVRWKKENLWKPADGDDLPVIDREVIALLDNGKVVFAHRPPEYWDGKDIVTGKVTRNYPKTYDKGGWNIPDVKWWLDVELPKKIEL